MNSVQRKRPVGLYLVNGFLLLGLLHQISRSISLGNIDRALSESGQTALWVLILSLACRPLAMILGWKRSRPYKKTFGIYAFLFSLLHGVLFIQKQHFQLHKTLLAILSEANLIFALTGFLILAMLFVTSNKASIRYLKKGWKQLHRLIYPGVVLIVLHAMFLQDTFSHRTLEYPIIVSILLILRLPVVARYFDQRKKTSVRGSEEGPAVRKPRPMRPVFFLVFLIGCTLLVTAGVHRATDTRKQHRGIGARSVVVLGQNYSFDDSNDFSSSQLEGTAMRNKIYNGRENRHHLSRAYRRGPNNRGRH